MLQNVNCMSTEAKHSTKIYFKTTKSWNTMYIIDWITKKSNWVTLKASVRTQKLSNNWLLKYVLVETVTSLHRSVASLEAFSMTKLTNSSIKSVNELALLFGFRHNIWQLHLLAYPLVSVQKHSWKEVWFHHHVPAPWWKKVHQLMCDNTSKHITYITKEYISYYWTSKVA